jgi:dihydroflavonol-4-reductase
LKAFVTGATGFVGSHVARLLSEQGADLRLLVRAGSRQDNIAGLNAELVTGDLCNEASLRKGMEGCEFVFHVAADYRLFVRDPEPMYRANVDGTSAVIQAAEKAGVRRVIYTSSVATLGFGYEPVVVNEDTPVQEVDMVGHYKRSKFLAERRAQQLAEQGAPVIIVNPSTPVGEGDIKPTPTGTIVVDFLKKKFPAYVDTGLNIVDVHDVARGHLLAMTRGRPGERYVLGGENITLKQILDTLGELTGLPSPTVKVPHSVAIVSGFFDTLFTGYVMGKEPRVTVESARMGRKYMWVSSAKAERELGYVHGPAREALRRAAKWFADNGYAPAYRQVAGAAS